MANAMNCSDGWSAHRLAQVQREAPGAMSGNLQWTHEVCRAVGITHINVKSQTRVFSAVPALFLSGTLDTNTPPFQAEEVRWGFPNSVHIVIENGRHETLPSAEVQKVIVDFFKGEVFKGVLFRLSVRVSSPSKKRNRRLQIGVKPRKREG